MPDRQVGARDLLDAAKNGAFAYPAINVTSSQTLNAAIRGFAEAEFPRQRLREVFDGGAGHDDAVWQGLAEMGWQIAAHPTRPASMGWHGNALLVRKGLEVLEVESETLPQLEPRGAIRAKLLAGAHEICVTCMHLDLSGLLRKRQFAHLCNNSRAPGLPAVMLGDCNEWIRPIGGERGLAAHWEMVEPGRSFPARRPLLALDRLMHTPHWGLQEADVHSSPLARQASDHLPIKAALRLHKK